MKKINNLLLLFIIISIIIAGCNFPLSREPENIGEDEVVVLSTLVAQTLEALQNQLQQIPTPTVSIPTLAPIPTLPGPELTQPTIPAAANSSASCLLAGLVSETIPDNTAFAPGDPFTKTWTIINSGSCDWAANYQLVFISGEQMGGVSPTPLNINVPAGNFTDISVALAAPTTPGTYRSDWGLQNENGTVFAPFYAQIVVSDVGDFVVTSGSLSSVKANDVAVCPYTYNYSADITPNRSGSATYYFEFEDASKTEIATLDFASSAAKTITASRTLTASGNYSVKLYIDSPNHQYLDTLDFYLSCSP
jgi:hypothetical protein